MHTGEKPFDCRICGKDFSRGDKLKDHLKRHDAEDKLTKIRKQIFNPEDCSSGVVGSTASNSPQSSTDGPGNSSTGNATATPVSNGYNNNNAAAATAAPGLGDSLSNIDERMANLVAKANPQAVTPDSIMSAKTTVAAATALQHIQQQQQRHLQLQQQIQQMQQQSQLQHQQTLLLQQQQQQQHGSPSPVFASKKRKLSSAVSSSSPSSSGGASGINALSSSSSSTNAFGNIVSMANNLINNSISSNAAAAAAILVTSNGSSSGYQLPAPSISSNMSEAASSTSVGGSNGVANIIPQMLGVASIGECILRPIN